MTATDISAGMTMLNGVLSSHPVSGGGYRDGNWSLTIGMLAYKLADKDPVIGRFTARKTIARSDMDVWFKRLQNQSTISMTGRMAILRPDPLWLQFEMDKYLGSSNDIEICELAAEFAKPVTKHDPVLGTLTLDRQFEQFSGKADFNGLTVSLGVGAEGEDFNPAARIATHDFFKNAKHWDLRLRRYAAEHLLELKNDNWSFDEMPASAREFIKSMTPVTIEVTADGNFCVDYSAGNMFLGHNIMVSGTLDSGPTRAHL